MTNREKETFHEVLQWQAIHVPCKLSKGVEQGCLCDPTNAVYYMLI